MPDNTHPLDPHLTATRQDVNTIADDIRWAHADAWWPTTTDPLQPSPRRTGDTDTTTAAPTNPDYVRGPKYALGVGDDTTRAILAEAIDELARLELRTAAALFTAGTRPQQPELGRPDHLTSSDQLHHVITGIQWRLQALHDDGRAMTKRARRNARRELAEARRHADRCVRHLTRALGRGEAAGVAHAEPRCRVCGIRPQAQREVQVVLPGGGRTTGQKPSKGGRCDTCAQWFTRNGSERPSSLDTVDDAHAAAARRRRRGEGWGSG